MSRASISNFKWPEMLKKYLYFLKTNDMTGLKKKDCYELFLSKANVKMCFSSFGNLISEKNKYFNELKEMNCPICLESHFDIFAKDETIFTPTCNHPVCATCLAITYFNNITVSN